MSKEYYLKDTREFWLTRKASRASLDKKRANASSAEKAEIAEKLRSDMTFLKSGEIILAKSRLFNKEE